MNAINHPSKRIPPVRRIFSSAVGCLAALLCVLAFFILIGVSAFTTLADQATPTTSKPADEHHVVVQTEKLRAIIADNEAFEPSHRTGYNGVAELSLNGLNPTNLFVPFYAGLNLEHIFSGDAESYAWNIFEPRRSPMKLVKLSPTSVELNQERTEHWPLKSRITFQVDGKAIDFTFRGTPLDDAWKKHGYIGIFFASYMNGPGDLSIQFIGRSRPGRGDAAPRWIKHLSPSHGVSATHRPAGSTWDPPIDDGFQISLVSGHSDVEYIYPFYFGRFGENVVILMFERPTGDNELRFAQSPTGGGSGNPAWDFVYFQRAYKIDQPFGFRGRLVYKPFISLADVIGEYEKWSGEKVSAFD